MSALLEVEDLCASYGASQALFGVSFTLKEGCALALMGRNGMGKTTTIACITRMMAANSGRISFAGQDLSRLPSHRAARLGLGLVPEGRRAFAGLTVRENLMAAARRGEWTMARVCALFPRLAERAGQRAETLSGGEQQMLVIGRALMTNPKLLILDEATEGLAPVVRAEIWAAIRELKAQGQSILVVDKSLRELATVADDCVVLERGRDVWHGSPAALSGDLAQQYLGV
ncbi:amino acid/amide ABC transporter ATP-binding protein 2 (HAAT family) [Limimaricola soesokkakensis]|uniref:Amino acid/amide ABC transporter ATP-binding protein 2 (HAAT family) n=1 Tax=Limimaricola soesokkakensis TaxID=1343159 RepID=A0A1X6Z127_9RHOB|nr:ABC transporter ATP-binding protein [Limimaricola soesokkakensis]PSK87943.1 amino acid/amide ABC transporter ATP-binding protein 2 (HAAT family) [Limimaricola soesokkakensis]SLN37102.1 High-affinity branched-chain amino acid transport ATP-binding protein LivF [Limimaricola soesokkakensis]